MTRGERVWTAAQALVGTRFRLHGRDAASGLDCVGLVTRVLADAGVDPGAVPDAYRIDSADVGSVADGLARAGLVQATDARCGDVLLLRLARRRLHLAIAGPDAIIHAHAGLRRVVLTPGDPPGKIAGRWRVREEG